MGVLVYEGLYPVVDCDHVRCRPVGVPRTTVPSLGAVCNAGLRLTLRALAGGVLVLNARYSTLASVPSDLVRRSSVPEPQPFPTLSKGKVVCVAMVWSRLRPLAFGVLALEATPLVPRKMSVELRCGVDAFESSVAGEPAARDITGADVRLRPICAMAGRAPKSGGCEREKSGDVSGQTALVTAACVGAAVLRTLLALGGVQAIVPGRQLPASFGASYWNGDVDVGAEGFAAPC
jgi:hypothetical protein